MLQRLRDRQPLIREDEFGRDTELGITSERAKATVDRCDLQVAVRGDAMREIQEMLANSKRVEVGIVLFRSDFYDLEMKAELDPSVADLEECWRVEPKPGWTVVADDQGNMSAEATERYEPPAGWQWVATVALVLTPGPNRPDGMCWGRGLWFPMAGVNPRPHMETFLAFLCDEMIRRAHARAGARAVSESDFWVPPTEGSVL
jgi:hypothetical protein